MAWVALQEEDDVGTPTVFLRNFRPVGLEVAARLGETDDAGLPIVEGAEFPTRQMIHQHLYLRRRLAQGRRMEHAVEGPEVAIGAVSLHQQKPVERELGRSRLQGAGEVYPGEGQTLLAPMVLVHDSEIGRAHV